MKNLSRMTDYEAICFVTLALKSIFNNNNKITLINRFN